MNAGPARDLEGFDRVSRRYGPDAVSVRGEWTVVGLGTRERAVEIPRQA